MAAIKGLTREEYIDFFYGVCNRAEVYDDMYDSIRVYLSKEMTEFWDSLLSFFDWQDVYNSSLFSSEPYIEATAINQNKILQSDEYYNKLRQVIDSVSIRTYEGEILNIASTFNVPYDLIYLSNIIYYVNKERYKDMLSKLPISEQGMILTYLYSIEEVVKEMFNSDSISYEQFTNSHAGLMIYHK